MVDKKKLAILFCGFAAGCVNGLFGAGGGMVLVPLLGLLSDLEEDEIFPASVCIILPVSVISLIFSESIRSITFARILPYILGSAAGGICCGFWGKHIPVKWLHRVLGILVIWGGVRYLC